MPEALQDLKNTSSKIHVLGGGTNLIVAPQIQSVIHCSDSSWKIVKRTSRHVWLECSMGHDFSAFVGKCIQHQCFGIENLSLIPGSFGGAIVQNIGAYGVEIGNFVESVKALEVATGKLFILSQQECRFSYRNSFFKKNPEFIVLSGVLKLSTQFRPQSQHQDVQNILLNNPTITASELSSEIAKIRRHKLPYPPEVPNVGSFFVNPIINQEQLTRAGLTPASKGVFPFGDAPKSYKVSAGLLLEKLGFKGFRMGKVAMSKQHALVMVNDNGGTYMEVYLLKEHIQNTLQEKFAISLVCEPVFWEMT